MSYIPSPGEIVPVSKSPGYIVLSYVVSYLGCQTALELLARRTHHGGHYNWFLLGGAATAMGGVAIWSMHYIGMQAMVMAQGQDELQLFYYASYTAGSFFLPIAVVALSFSVFSSSRRASTWRIAIAGSFCGAAICGMHYVGQAGIVNYNSIWSAQYVIGSVIIAMGAATVALGVFFWLSSRWINALWKRGLCALILAGAVCLMHWTAVLGTSFAWKGLQDTSLPPGLSKDAATWVCGALAVSCCLVLFVLAVLFQYIRRQYAQKAQQISLALAYFAPEGTIMLNNGGNLPLNKITKNYLQFSAKDSFDVDSVPFSWMYRASRNWSCVNDLISSMRLHAHLEQGADNVSIVSVKGTKPCSYATLLKELYCIAAEDLARAAQIPLTDVGTLFDRILNTGRMMPQLRIFGQGGATTITTGSDSKRGPRMKTTLTRGQVLFLVRHLTRAQTTHLQTVGYSFAPPKSVISHLAASMQITAEELKPYLDDLINYKETPQMLESGIHLACFIVKPNIGAFDILAKRSRRNQMPTVALPLKKLEHWQTSLLAQYDNWEGGNLLQYWGLDTTQSALTQGQRDILNLIYHAMIELRDRIGETIFDKSRFVAQPLTDPGIDANTPGGAGSIAVILAFRFVTDIHYMHPATSPDIFVNARLFTTSQHCYPGSSDHAVFSSQVHNEFSTVQGINDTSLRAQSSEEQFRGRHKKLSSRPFSLIRRSKHSESDDDIKLTDQSPTKTVASKSSGTFAREGPFYDDEGEKDLISAMGRASPEPSLNALQYKPRSFFGSGGGIHVNNEISITVADAETDSTAADETGKLGMRTEIGAVRERESAVDILMALTLGGLRA